MPTLNSSLRVSEEIAIIVPETEFKVTYKDLSDITGHLQVMFRDQSSPIFQGDKRSTVAIAMPNGLEYISVFLALTMDGYIAAPLNPAYKSSEFNFYLEDLKSKLIIVQKGTIRSKEGQEILKSAKQFECFIVEVGYEQKRERIEYEVFIPENNYHTPVYRSLKQAAQFVNTEGNFPGNSRESDVALILHTSGTTSRPKAVPLSHLNITTSMKNISNTYKLTKDDSSYVVMPLFHVHGLIGVVLSTLFTQGAVVVPNRFSASWFWADYIVNKCTWFSFSPTIGRILLSNPLPTKVPHIRFIRSCSSPLDAATYHNLESKLKAPVLEAYAMTEAAHQMTSNDLPPAIRKIGTVGKPQGVKVLILGADNQVLPQGQEGEISISGLNVTAGYINNEKANRENFVQENGYFKTGDLGYFDEDGFLVVKGRRSEIINRGGEKISPAEVDEAVLSNPSVSEAVAFAVPDAKYGQTVHAAVVLKPGASLTFEELTSFLRKKVVGFKIPARVHFVTSLPKTATGKTQRKVVAKAFESESKL